MSQTYSSSYYEVIRNAEDTHFWFLARGELLGKFIKHFVSPIKKPGFLEIGCGTGVILKLLEELGYEVTGLDVNAKALQFAGQKSEAKLIRSSIFSFKTEKRFAAVGAFDVAEHLSDDGDFLKRCYDLLIPGGTLFLTVPAGRWLWSAIDDYSGHKRRYEPSELIGKVKKAGFSLKFWNYWNVLPLPFFLSDRMLVTRKVNQNVIARYLKIPHPLINKTMELLLRLENKFMFRVRYPAGASLVLCADKPDKIKINT